MPAVTLAEAKQHLRVLHDFEDDYISSLVAVADSALEGQGVATAAPVPASVKHAALLIVGHFFNSREAVGPEKLAKLPMGVDMLVAPHRGMIPAEEVTP